MSCTLVLVPAVMGANLMVSLITTLVAGAAVSTAAGAMSSLFVEKNQSQNTDNVEQMMIANAMNKQYDQYTAICSQYKTAFKDENLLIKTLNEHGVQNITTQDGKIYGTLEALKFEFEKDSEGLYEMHITHNEGEDLSVVDELNDEYQTNVQEQSYMNIKKNLEKQNMKIDTEEVLEDNTIMITVNLE